MDKAKPLNTPMTANLKLTKQGRNLMFNPTLYRSIVGALQYVTITRPEIAYSVNKVFQFMKNLLDELWKVVKRILCVTPLIWACDQRRQYTSPHHRKPKIILQSRHIQFTHTYYFAYKHIYTCMTLRW